MAARAQHRLIIARHSRGIALTPPDGPYWPVADKEWHGSYATRDEQRIT